MRFCSKCGNQNQTSSAFCQGCGDRLQSNIKITESATPPSLPTIWSPGVAAIWSIILSPLFGIIVHLMNWRALGEKKKVQWSIFWLVIVGTVNIAIIIGLTTIDVLELLQGKEFDDISRSLNRASFALNNILLIVWWSFFGFKQRDHLRSKFGGGI